MYYRPEQVLCYYYYNFFLHREKKYFNGKKSHNLNKYYNSNK